MIRKFHLLHAGSLRFHEDRSLKENFLNLCHISRAFETYNRNDRRTREAVASFSPCDPLSSAEDDPFRSSELDSLRYRVHRTLHRCHNTSVERASSSSGSSSRDRCCGINLLVFVSTNLHIKFSYADASDVDAPLKSSSTCDVSFRFFLSMSEMISFKKSMWLCIS